MREMINLDEVMEHVERIELSAHTRHRHLAHLHALQAAHSAPNETEVHARVGSQRRSRTALTGSLAAAAVIGLAGGSALLASGHHAATAPAASGAHSPSVATSATDYPTSAVLTTGHDTPGLPDAEFSKQLAAILGLTDAQANVVTAQLNSLGRGVDPNSAQFTQIASNAGVKPTDLAAAIDRIKKAYASESAFTGSALPKGNATDPGAGVGPTPSGTQVKGTGQNTENLLSSGRGIGLLGAVLGLSPQKATALAGKLAALDYGAGLDPRSSNFATIAHEFGLTPTQLASAIDQIKRAGQ